MGGIFGGLVGAGNVGNQLAEAKDINRQKAMTDEEFQQKRQAFAAQMAQMQQQLAGLKQSQSAVKWDSTPLTRPDGQIVYRGVDPKGKIVYSNPQKLSTIQKSAALVPHRLTPNAVTGQEAAGMGALTYSGLPPDPSGKFYVDEISGRNIAIPFGTPTAQDKPSKAFSPPGGGAPVGIIRDNKAILPGSAGWTPEDQKMFDAETKSYKNQQQNITDRNLKVARERYSMILQIPIPVVKADGSIGFASRQQVNQNPEDYAPAGPATNIMGVKARFGEIRKTAQLVNMAIDKLPETGFDVGQRAKIAMVMGNDHPEGAWQNFVQGGFANTLTLEQVDYVTALMSMMESANALSSLQGIGRGGTDLVRHSIQRMLPGPGTPSRPYAKRQMQLFNTELDQLERGLPRLPGSGNNQSNKQYQPGQEVMYKGQKRRVKAIDPSGKVILEPEK